MSNVINSSTKLINIETNAYPVYLSQVRAESGISFGAEPEEEQILLLGYAVVLQVEKPAGDVVTEGPPEEVAGEYIQNWIVRPFNADELAANLETAKAKAKRDLTDLFTRTLDKGAPYTWPDDTREHIQLRDGDRANLTGIGARADRKISQGVESDPVLGFRTYENNWKPLTPTQARAMTDYSYEAYVMLLQQQWALEAQILAAEVIGDIPVIPEEMTLPE